MESKENIQICVKKVDARQPHERRLDELAWLLEGRSMCTAIANVGNQFLISANEFFQGTQGRKNNQQLEFMCQIMEYLQALARDREIFVPSRDELIQWICDEQIKTSTFGRINISEDILKKVVLSLLLEEALSEKGLLSLANQEELKQENKEKAYLALGYALPIFNRLRKIESSIKKNEDITNNQFQAFANFNHDEKNGISDILFFEPEQGVHAELQILSQTVLLVEQNIQNGIFDKSQEHAFYIGISKRCCLNCHCMLDAANEILNKFNIFVKYDDSHDMLFEGNWIMPKIFEEGARGVFSLKNAMTTRAKSKQNQESGNLTLSQQIGLAYSIKIQQYKEDFERKSGKMGHSRSSSEASQTAEFKLEQYRQKCQNELAVLIKYDHGEDADAEMLKFGLDLCSYEGFKELFKPDNTNEDFKQIIYALLTDINNKLPAEGKIEMDYLIGFLRNKKYSTEEIYNYLNSVQKESNENEIEVSPKKQKVSP